MSYTLQTTEGYRKNAAKFFKKRKYLAQKYLELSIRLAQDPFHVSLHTHALTGRMKGLYAVSLTHSYRIVLSINAEKQIITVHRIGSHDEVYE